MRTGSSRRVLGIGRGLGLLLLAGAPATLAAQDIGHPGPSLAGSGPSVGNPSVTESKPQSKLWTHDGSWWGSLWSADALAFHIQRLDQQTHTWIDTGVLVEDRPDSHSDALWDGTKLYLATHEFATGAGSPGDPILVLRYSYVGGAFQLDPGFPVTIGDSSTESLVIDKDSTGALWAVWMQGLRVHYSTTLGSDTQWSAPAILPACTSNVTSDDICSIRHFGGDRVGVLWSDNAQESFQFATHLDGALATDWSAATQPLPGENDDHISLARDAAGRLFAAVKNDADQIKLLVLQNGSWQQHLVSEASAAFTRAIVVLDESQNLVRVFATSNNEIREKTSALDAIAFAPGNGTVVIRDADAPVNNATSSKQNVSAATGLVVLAANLATTGTYWHHALAGTPPPRGLSLETPQSLPAGGAVLLTATAAAPLSVVGFYVGMHPGASVITRPQCPGGVELELDQPFRRLGTARANAQGVATLQVHAPLATAGKTFYFQAIEPTSCAASNVLQRVMAAPRWR